MPSFLVFVGFIGYGISVLIFFGAPSVVQEIAAILVATNATLFFIGGIIAGYLAEAQKTVTPPLSSPQ